MSDRISRALRDVPRRRFLPAEVQSRASEDLPLPIGYNQTNSQPTTVAWMLRLLDVQPGDRVLDVGCGSGWTTALLAALAGPQGRVEAVERIPELVRTTRSAAAAFGVEPHQVHCAVPGVLGLPEHAPYDRILLSAMAERAPCALFNQLAVNGVLVGPWKGMMHRVERLSAPNGDLGEIEITTHGRFSFVPLIE